MQTITRLAIFVVAALLVATVGRAADRPNIILFVSDDHGTDALGCYGNPMIKTPNMDRLAADGVRFTRTYCTSASCAASRAVILTGQYQPYSSVLSTGSNWLQTVCSPLNRQEHRLPSAASLR